MKKELKQIISVYQKMGHAQLVTRITCDYYFIMIIVIHPCVCEEYSNTILP